MNTCAIEKNESEINLRHAQFEDDLLTTIMRQSKLSPLDVATAYHKLRSFDKLLNFIVEAEYYGLSLPNVIKTSELNQYVTNG